MLINPEKGQFLPNCDMLSDGGIFMHVDNSINPKGVPYIILECEGSSIYFKPLLQVKGDEYETFG